MYKRLFLPLFAVLALFACNNSSNNNCTLNEDGVCVGSPECPSGTILNGNGECVSVSADKIGAYAVLPNNQNVGKIQEMYNKWIDTYYITFEDGETNSSLAREAAFGSARIKAAFSGSTDGSRTASEAIGYGMILASLMNDWDKFDKLLKYSKAFRYPGTALMVWDVVGFRSEAGAGPATDADIDIALSLFIAYKKTDKQDYLRDAIDIGASIYEYEIDASTRLILPAMKGERMGNGTLYNISYFSLPAIKMFAQYDKDRDWDDVLNKNISYMENVQNNGAGLWPDWSNAEGVPIDPNNNSNQTFPSSQVTGGDRADSYECYYKESPRIPLRIALYYHWYGDQRAKAMLDKGMAFLRTKGVENDPGKTKTFYSYDGQRESSSATTSTPAMIWSSLCALGMGNSSNQEWLNKCNEKLTSGFASPTLNQYYGNSLQLIYAMFFNGKFSF